MTTYDNTNSGVLFKNNKKETEKQPDYIGKLDVEGKEWALAAWIRKSKDGKPFMSVKVSQPMVGKSGKDDSIPF